MVMKTKMSLVFKTKNVHKFGIVLNSFVYPQAKTVTIILVGLSLRLKNLHLIG